MMQVEKTSKYHKHYAMLLQFVLFHLALQNQCFYAFYSRIQTSQWVGVGCAVEGICQVVKVKQITVSIRYSCSPLSHAPFTMATVRSAKFAFLNNFLFCFFKKKVTTKNQIPHISAGHVFQDLPIRSERRRTINLGTVLPTK